MTDDSTYRRLSFWLDTVPGSLEPRPSLTADIEADVAIVGAGLTGLWTAYYLNRADPKLSIVICEREIAGYGASGRNGGWCSALFPASLAKLERIAGREPAIAMITAMQRTVDEVGAVAAAENIDCHWAKGGTAEFARSPVQLQRARKQVTQARLFGFDESDIALLSAEQASELAGVPDVLGALYTPHCAAIHPARLARGLARVLTERGVRIFERTPVTRIGPHELSTEGGTVTARYVVRATEAYTSELPGLHRAIIPLYSLVIATAPLSAEILAQIGLDARPTFADLRNLIIYGQRTADGRLVFGGAGAPYHFGARIGPSFDRVPEIFAALRDALIELFPVLSDVAVTHTWGGPFGVARDWCASVGLDPSTGIAWAGGYVGDGVATTNLAGRTLTDLITGNDSELTRLPWVGHSSRRWEPEPLRWLGISTGIRALAWADRAEASTGRPWPLASMFGKLTGN